MSTESEIGIRRYRRRWIARLLGESRFRFELQLTPHVEVAADADTVRGAWDGVVAAAKIFHGFTVTTPCPYDGKGNLFTEDVTP